VRREVWLTFAVSVACPRNLLQTMRLIKSPAEIDVMRRSTEISGQAFREIMRATQPGI
jgi:Xaa-Pro aminopeptidase